MVAHDKLRWLFATNNAQRLSFSTEIIGRVNVEGSLQGVRILSSFAIDVLKSQMEQFLLGMIVYVASVSNNT